MKLRLSERSYVIVSFLTAAILGAQPVNADEVRIKLPAPPVPKIVLPVPPPMIWLPVPQVYVAHATPHPIFFHAKHYYLHHHDVWYIGPGHGGPWTTIREKQLPPGLRKFHKNKWGDYQREADDRFRHGKHDGHPAFYAGNPNKRAYWKDDEHERGRSHDGSKGKDRKDKDYKERKEKKGKD